MYVFNFFSTCMWIAYGFEFCFVEGMYNARALSILGHNPDFDNARLLEVAVFSGSLEAIHC
ncbi:hypothetical protein NC652_009790 [Populus alba x Populus x berolinensis]|nr:hypothetical protein NC652_009790 [Populus alba x Populus x berolinensis]